MVLTKTIDYQRHGLETQAKICGITWHALLLHPINFTLNYTFQDFLFNILTNGNVYATKETKDFYNPF